MGSSCCHLAEGESDGSSHYSMKYGHSRKSFVSKTASFTSHRSAGTTATMIDSANTSRVLLAEDIEDAHSRGESPSSVPTAAHENQTSGCLAHDDDDAESRTTVGPPHPFAPEADDDNDSRCGRCGSANSRYTAADSTTATNRERSRSATSRFTVTFQERAIIALEATLPLEPTSTGITPQSTNETTPMHGPTIFASSQNTVNSAGSSVQGAHAVAFATPLQPALTLPSPLCSSLQASPWHPNLCLTGLRSPTMLLTPGSDACTPFATEDIIKPHVPHRLQQARQSLQGNLYQAGARRASLQ